MRRTTLILLVCIAICVIACVPLDTPDLPVLDKKSFDYDAIMIREKDIQKKSDQIKNENAATFGND